MGPISAQSHFLANGLVFGGKVIEVSQSFKDLPKFSIPLGRCILDYLKKARVENLIVQIRVEGEALSAVYQGQGLKQLVGRHYYTGAVLSGAARFSMIEPERFLADKVFRVEIRPPTGMAVRTLEAPEAPEQAPFSRLLRERWLPEFSAIVEVVTGKKYGLDENLCRY